MYTQARYFIRTALAYLLAVFLVGGLVLANQGLALDSHIGTLLPVFYHLLMVGWATQLICGVALWMFPPLSREQPRGDERLAWLCYGALNSGVALAALHDPVVVALDGAPSLGATLLQMLPVLAGLLYVLAASAFIAHAWPRVIAFRTLPRPAQGDDRG